jgi:hypothetical protein
MIVQGEHWQRGSSPLNAGLIASLPSGGLLSAIA